MPNHFLSPPFSLLTDFSSTFMRCCGPAKKRFCYCWSFRRTRLDPQIFEFDYEKVADDDFCLFL